MTSILIYSSSEDSSISYWTSCSDIEEYTEFDYQFSLGIAPTNSSNINNITSEKQILTYKQLSIGEDSGLNIAYLDSFFDSARLEEYYIAFKDSNEEITIKPYWKTPEGETCSIQIGTPEE